MTVRKEWTEWHLTPRGWERGATRVHGQGNTWVEEPTRPLLSCVYQELESGDPPEIKKWSEETWRSKENEKVGRSSKNPARVPSGFNLEISPHSKSASLCSATPSTIRWKPSVPMHIQPFAGRLVLDPVRTQAQNISV